MSRVSHMNSAISNPDESYDLSPAQHHPWSDLTTLCETLVAGGVINRMEAAIIRLWLSADRWSGKDNGLDRVDLLVSRLLSEGWISGDERRELLDWLDHRC